MTNAEACAKARRIKFEKGIKGGRPAGSHSAKERQKRARIWTAKSTVPHARMKPTMALLGWAAGFLEGEGSFTKNRGIRVCAAQVNPEPLMQLLHLFGGRITPRYTGRAQDQVYGVWQVTGARARGVIFTLYSMMSAKRQSQMRETILRWAIPAESPPLQTELLQAAVPQQT